MHSAKTTTSFLPSPRATAVAAVQVGVSEEGQRKIPPGLSDLSALSLGWRLREEGRKRKTANDTERTTAEKMLLPPSPSLGWRTFSEECGADAHVCGPALYRRFEVAAHTHGQLREYSPAPDDEDTVVDAAGRGPLGTTRLAIVIVTMNRGRVERSHRRRDRIDGRCEA